MEITDVIEEVQKFARSRSYGVERSLGGMDPSVDREDIFQDIILHVIDVYDRKNFSTDENVDFSKGKSCVPFMMKTVENFSRLSFKNLRSRIKNFSMVELDERTLSDGMYISIDTEDELIPRILDILEKTEEFLSEGDRLLLIEILQTILEPEGFIELVIKGYSIERAFAMVLDVENTEVRSVLWKTRRILGGDTKIKSNLCRSYQRVLEKSIRNEEVIYV